MLKVNSLDKILWKKAIGGVWHDDAHSVVGLPNGDIAVVGDFNFTFTNTDGFFALLSITGRVRQLRLFGDNFDDTLQTVAPARDGSFFIAGDLYTPFGASQDYQGIVMKLSPALLL